MLSVPTDKVPKKVYVKVARAENLDVSSKDKKKRNTKFKIVVLGGKTKDSSVVVKDQSGSPQWNFSCIIKLHRQQTDPIALLVEDSDGHHKGQVIIPVIKIAPKPYTCSTIQDPATSMNLLCNELEPSSKCSEPKGFLYYWIWIEEYYSTEDLDPSRKSFNKSMSSLFGSKSRLSAKSTLALSNAGSVNDLNNPGKHKKSGSLLKLKLHGNKKSDDITEKQKESPYSSDHDSISHSSIIIGNPFDVDNFNIVSHHDAKNPFEERESLRTQSKNPFQAETSDKISIQSYGTNSEKNLTDGDSLQASYSSGINPVIAPAYKSDQKINKSSMSITSSTVPIKQNIPTIGDYQNHMKNDSRGDIRTGNVEQEHNARPDQSRSFTGNDFSNSNDRTLYGLSGNWADTSHEEMEMLKQSNTEKKTEVLKRTTSSCSEGSSISDSEVYATVNIKSPSKIQAAVQNLSAVDLVKGETVKASSSDRSNKFNGTSEESNTNKTKFVYHHTFGQDLPKSEVNIFRGIVKGNEIQTDNIQNRFNVDAIDGNQNEFWASDKQFSKDSEDSNSVLYSPIRTTTESDDELKSGFNDSIEFDFTHSFNEDDLLKEFKNRLLSNKRISFDANDNLQSILSGESKDHHSNTEMSNILELNVHKSSSNNINKDEIKNAEFLPFVNDIPSANQGSIISPLFEKVCVQKQSFETDNNDKAEFKSGSKPKPLYFDQSCQFDYVELKTFENQQVQTILSDNKNSSQDCYQLLELENADLKKHVSILERHLTSVEMELDSIKDVLYQLRLKLLEDGATKYLEI